MTDQRKVFQDIPLTEAHHHDLIQSTLELTEDERVLLEQNGFVVIDRLQFPQFQHAYGWIYWKDLPVLVTTDAILHTIHQTYDKLLQAVEESILSEKLSAVLEGAKAYLTQHRPDSPALARFYDELDLYLSVPIALLNCSPYPGHFQSLTIPLDLPKEVLGWIRLLLVTQNRQSLVNDSSDAHADSITTQMDLSRFVARGHYADPGHLIPYFCAMTWLQVNDFRFVTYDAIGQPEVQPDQIAKAWLLLDAIMQSGQMHNWQEIEGILSAFVGSADNITLYGLQCFFDAAGITSARQCLQMDPTRLLNLLLLNDYGKQTIRGSGQMRMPGFNDELPNNIVFALLGSLYTIDIDIIQRVTFDHLVVDGKPVPRAFPSPFDVMVALGNERGLTHLREELGRYGYEATLRETRVWLNSHSDDFWQHSFYNRWLNAIRALNIDTSSENYPPSMRGAAWADKTLQTQLASWAQLRHDNILYAKPVIMAHVICDYPAGYVEPYPGFYAALAEYAHYGKQAFADLSLPEVAGNIQAGIQDDPLHKYRAQLAAGTLQKALKYFDDLASIMTTLQGIAEAELAGKALSEDQTLFLRSITIRKDAKEDQKCAGGPGYMLWDGWFSDLLPFGDESSELVADIHSNTNGQIGEVGVLHIGTRDPVVMVFSAECDGRPTLFVGPVFTVQQHMQLGTPLFRLTDHFWPMVPRPIPVKRRPELEESRRLLRQRLKDAFDDPKTAALLEYQINELNRILDGSEAKNEAWTTSFRAYSDNRTFLRLPGTDTILTDALRPQLRDVLAPYLGKSSNDVQFIVDLTLNSPETIRNFEGMTDALFDELMQVLKNRRYLS